MSETPACPSCERAVAPDARFCPNCGTALGGRIEERRVATVLFADVVGYTALAETRDPEQVKAIVDQCFERLVHEIEDFGGTVDKIIGDAIVALFGAPVAHEDDAERAVRAALRLQDVILTEFTDGDEPLRLRIGVNTGEVVVGALRAGGEYTAMGDAVNVAQRLQAAARPGMVLVGAATHAGTSEVIRYQDFGLVAARNREEPIEAWIATSAIAPPGRRPRRTRTPFVGRDAELALAEGLVRLAWDRSRVQVLLVHGETGVGKGRLVQEIAAHATSAYEALVLEGRCVPYGESNPWWPLAEALRYGLGLNHPSVQDDDPQGLRVRVAEVLALTCDDDEVVRTTDALCVALGLPSPLDLIEPTRARDEVARAILVLFAALARGRMLLIVLHDLHWADEPVLQVAKALGRRLATERALIVATTRRSDGEAALSPPGVAHSVVVLQLDPLDRAASGQLLDALATDLDDQRRELLLDRSAGNPYFLEELAQLVSSGDDGGALPENLRGLVLARLDRLRSDERALVDNAAVLGSSGSMFALSRFAEALGQSFDPTTMPRLVAKDLFEVEGGRWSFRSESVREVAYATLTKAARAERHLGVARSMSERDPEGRSIADHVAHHLASAAELAAEIGPASHLPAGIATEAVAWLSRAADRHIRNDEPAAALRVVERARQLGSADTPHCHDLELAAGWAFAIKRRLHDAESVAEEVLKEAGDDALRGRALTLLAEVAQHRGALVQSDELAGRATVLLDAAGDSVELARALRVQGMTNLYAFELERAGSTLDRARALSDSIGDRRGVAWADQHLAWLAFVEGNPDRADQRIDAAIATFRELGDNGGRQWGLGLRAWVRFQQGRFAEAMALADSVLADGHDMGDQWALAMMLLLKADLSLWMGRSAQAIELAQDARAILTSLEDAFGQALSMAPLIRGQLSIGDSDAARRSLEELDSITGRDGPQMLAQTLRLGAAVHAGQGDRVPHETIAAIAAIESAPVAYEAFVLAGFACLQAGELDDALVFAERAAEARPAGHPFVGGLLSLLSGVSGEYALAIEQASGVLDRPDATYLDRVTALVARAAARSAAGDLAGADADAVEALGVADGTDDVVARLIARLAAQVVLECSGSDTTEIADRVADLQAAAGTDGAGWARALRLVTVRV